MSSSDMPTWWFRERLANEKQREPVQGEFFNEDSIADTAHALMREAIQNSLDARRDGWPVNFALTVGDVAPEVASRYLASIKPHVEASMPGAYELVERDPCHYLVVEDFNTTGLTGDANDAFNDGGERNNFHGFFRAEGASAKGGTDRGRWGLGKYVFPSASAILSFFALTVQHPDGHDPIEQDGESRLLMGGAVLKTHKVGGTHYTPDGYWAADPEALPVPFRDTALVDRFASDWQVSRQPSQGGLSIVVPYVDRDLDADTLARAILKEYFVAIERGQLEVRIQNDGEPISITKATLDEELARLTGDEQRRVRRSVEMVRWYEGLGNDGVIHLESDGAAEVSMMVSEEIREQVQATLERDGRVAVRAPVTVRPVDPAEGTQETSVTVLFADDPAHGSSQLFCRGGLLIPDVGQPTTHQGITSLLLADEAAIVQFLGDAEDPGHTKWKENSQHFRDKYVKGPTWLRFVRHFPGRFMREVRRSEDELVEDLLSQWLSVPKEEPGRATGATGTGNGEGPEPTDLPDERRGRWSVHRSVDGGLKIGAKEAGDATIRIAYDLAQGNAFKAYEVLDFSFNAADRSPGGTLDVGVDPPDGSSVTIDSSNRIKVAGLAEGTSVTIKGLDRNRDVKVEVTP